MFFMYEIEFKNNIKNWKQKELFESNAFYITIVRIYNQTYINFKGSYLLYFIFRFFTLSLFLSFLSYLIVILFIIFYSVIKEIHNLTLSRERLLLIAINAQCGHSGAGVRFSKVILFPDSTNYSGKPRSDQWLWYVSLYSSMENNMHYSKQNIMDSMIVNAALASLVQQTSHSLQSLCFIPRNVIVYCHDHNYVSSLEDKDEKIRWSVFIQEVSISHEHNLKNQDAQT